MCFANLLRLLCLVLFLATQALLALVMLQLKNMLALPQVAQTHNFRNLHQMME